MKIFLDPYFYQLHPGPRNIFYDYLSVPEHCDLVGISFYSNELDYAVQVIDYLMLRTKKLLVNLAEPTDVKFVISVMKRYRNSNVYLFSNIVCNFTPPDNFTTKGSWFIHSENFYATRPWAKDRLQKIKYGTKAKMFDCLLGGQNLHRDIIENLYHNSNCRDLIVYNYYRNNINNGTWDSDVNDYHLGQDPNCETSQVHKQTLVPINVYNQTHYSIVAETVTYNEFNHYTEKVAKPIVAKRLFVVFAGQHYLKNLRSLGFRTFGSVIDESYDSEPNMPLRMKQAWEQVEWLCLQDPDKVRSELLSILEHNQQHFIQTDWQFQIKKHF